MLNRITFCLIISSIIYSSYGINCINNILYRTYDGSCNNLIFNNWGKTHETFAVGPDGQKFYPEIHMNSPDPVPTYKDIDFFPEDGRSGNPRNITNTIAARYDPSQNDPRNRNMFSIIFAQFIAHDIENNRFDNPELADFQGNLLTPIRDREDDACYKDGLYRCNDNDTVLVIATKKSVGEYKNGAFTASNNASTYLDLSQVYGTNEDTALKLRSKVGGKLIVNKKRNFSIVMMDGQTVNYTLENFLPVYDEVQVELDKVFTMMGGTHLSIVGGDHRINENLGLSLFHTVWVREHNRVCDELMENNIFWKLFPTLFDEIIYQKAREITISKYQKIVYDQFLPYLIGYENMHLLGQYEGYNILENPTLTATFASAAFRYGHFAMKDYPAMDECGVIYKFGRPSDDDNHVMAALGALNPIPDYLTHVGRVIESGSYGNVARGMISKVGTPLNFTTHPAIRNLIGERGRFDVAALDIMRARFNSVPPYVTVRKHYHRSTNTLENTIYGLNDCPAHLEHDELTDDPIECFLHITSNVDNAQRLKDLYGKLTNVDAIVGLMLEDYDNTTSIGPTARNIIIDQFKKLRDGDRFYYENLIRQQRFTQWEKDQIMNTNMGDILNRNLDGNAASFPENPFFTPDNYRTMLQNSC